MKDALKCKNIETFGKSLTKFQINVGLISLNSKREYILQVNRKIDKAT